MTTSSVPEISVAFATTLDTPEPVEPAEPLGFARAWVYDTDIHRAVGRREGWRPSCHLRADQSLWTSAPRCSANHSVAA